MSGNKITKGYKGFDDNFKCRDMQYEVGETYKCERAEACAEGFHFFESPQDVFGYYAPAQSRFAEVVGTGQVDRDNDDSKVACTELTIVREITLNEMIGLAIQHTVDSAKPIKGSHATGYRGAASATGAHSIACGLGWKNKAQGGESSWLVLAERNDRSEILFVKTAKVDGKTIKADTWYGLVDGEFVEVK